MILLSSFLNRFCFYLLLLAMLALSGCAIPGGGARSVTGTPVRLTARAAGPAEVAGKLFEFHLLKDGRDLGVVHGGTAPVWEWTPQEPGEYRTRTVVRDPAGKILTESDWSVPYKIVPPLAVKTPEVDRPTPQTAGTAIRWTVQASGGVGEITYEFRLRRVEGEVATLQSGPASRWLWSPVEAGRYLVWVVAADAQGNQAASQWSVPYEILPQLAVKALAPDRPSPQTAGTAVRWQAETSGGVGSRTWKFYLQDGKEEVALLQEGDDPVWNWAPDKPGSYRILAVVRDSLGNTADSGWSDPYLIDSKPGITALPEPEPAQQPLIAVLPIENLSGAGGAPTKQLRQALMEELKKAGFTLLGDDLLDQFMARHRIRYVGGIDTATAKAFLKETRTNAVLVTSLALYLDGDPPKIALFSRLVSTGDQPEILWIDGVGMAGDESPGLLDLGVIHDPKFLRDKVLSFLVSSLSKRPKGKSESTGFFKRTRTFRPKITYNASFLEKWKSYPVVVVPFSNEGERAHAGEIMALHFVRRLAAMDGYRVVEPGVVREKLLGLRVIMDQGISRGDLYVVSSSLGTDLLLGGKVTKYLDSNLTGGPPKVDFSAQLMEGAGRKIIWAAESYNQGDDGVFFYDVGMMHTAFEMTSKMVNSLLAEIERSRGSPDKESIREMDLLDIFRGGEQK